jgi:tetratricopeptide (TPR) repeat protein
MPLFVVRTIQARRLGPLSLAMLLAFVGGSLPGLALSHGDLHARIAAIEQQIAAEPNKADLYIRRAELHRQHRDWERAELDYAKARTLDPGHAELPWLQARATAEAGKLELALAQLDRFVERTPDHAAARLTRARVLAAVGRHDAAAADYALALAALPAPEPDHFLEQRDAQQRAGASLSAQLSAIERGLRQLGPVPSLEDAALDIEVSAGSFDSALARLDRQAAVSARKERWQYRRGLVLARAGRTGEAGDAFRAGLAEIGKLSPQLREARASHALVAQLREELKKLGIEDTPGPR